jgi:hypothetical protein
MNTLVKALIEAEATSIIAELGWINEPCTFQLMVECLTKLLMQKMAECAEQQNMLPPMGSNFETMHNGQVLKATFPSSEFDVVDNAFLEIALLELTEQDKDDFKADMSALLGLQ